MPTHDPTFNRESILSLAPNPSVSRSAQTFSVPWSWHSIQRDEESLRGLFPLRGKPPLRVQIRLADMVATCTCAGKAHPCAHVLALLLVAAQQPEHVAQGRTQTWDAEDTARVAAQDLLPIGPIKQLGDSAGAAYVRRRRARLDRGLDELASWLRDLVGGGFTAVLHRPRTYWTDMANRLFDAQARGLAARIQQMAQLPGKSPNWPDLLLAQAGQLHLISTAFDRYHLLSPQQQADLHHVVGWPPLWNKDDCRNDRWQILGRTLLTGGAQAEFQLWLWGLESGRPTCIRWPREGAVFPQLQSGRVLTGTLQFAYGTSPQRARLIQVQEIAPVGASLAGGSSIATAHAEAAGRRARNPWLDATPMLLETWGTTQVDNDWYLFDAAGWALPLPPKFDYNWHLAAYSHTRDRQLFGLWDGVVFTPLSVWTGERWLELRVLRGIRHSPVSRPRPATSNFAGVADQWAELVRIAMLGVERAQTPSWPGVASLEEVMRTQQDQSPEDALLTAAGVTALQQVVGRTPARLTRLPAAATAPPAASTLPPPVADLLAMMLMGNYSQLLPEYLGLVASRGATSPAELVPALLARGVNAISQRGEIIQLAGKTGRDLASRNPAWSYADPAVATWDGLLDRWPTLTDPQRRALVVQLRTHNPELGRALVQTVWKRHGAGPRALFLAALQTGLSAADEPFLETALDDRAEVVRRKAVGLLLAVPDARLRTRLAAAAETLLAWTPEAETQITVTPLGDVAPALQRDGVSVQPMRDTARLAGLQISHMLSAVPLEAWTTRWQADPATIVRAAQTSRWPRTLVTGWALAADYQRNSEWAQALLVESNFHPNTLRAVGVLTPDHFNRLIAEHADWSGPLHKSDRLVLFTRRWTAPWPDLHAARWIEAMGATLSHAEHVRVANSNEQSAAVIGVVKACLKQFALGADPKWGEEAAEQWLPRVAGDSPWWAAIHETVDTLQMRRRMHDTVSAWQPGRLS